MVKPEWQLTNSSSIDTKTTINIGIYGYKSQQTYTTKQDAATKRRLRIGGFN